jgi:hypothetical protein
MLSQGLKYFAQQMMALHLGFRVEASPGLKCALWEDFLPDFESFDDLFRSL